MLKTALDRGVDAGDQHGYLLTVTNNGPSVARAVVINDPHPRRHDVRVRGADERHVRRHDATVSCTIGDLLPGQVATVQLTVLLAPNLGETTLTNTASTTSDHDRSRHARTTRPASRRSSPGAPTWR